MLFGLLREVERRRIHSQATVSLLSDSRTAFRSVRISAVPQSPPSDLPCRGRLAAVPEPDALPPLPC